MIRGPPRSSLFPDTTRFRSPDNPLGLKGAGEGGTVGCGAAITSAIEDALGMVGAITALPVRPSQIRDLVRRRGDRKSTRLNSSHANISYAAFCLKHTATGTL